MIYYNQSLSQDMFSSNRSGITRSQFDLCFPGCTGSLMELVFPLAFAWKGWIPMYFLIIHKYNLLHIAVMVRFLPRVHDVYCNELLKQKNIGEDLQIPMSWGFVWTTIRLLWGFWTTIRLLWVGTTQTNVEQTVRELPCITHVHQFFTFWICWRNPHSKKMKRSLSHRIHVCYIW